MILKVVPEIAEGEEYPLFEESRKFFCKCEQCGKEYKVGHAREIGDDGGKWPWGEISRTFGPWVIKEGKYYSLNLGNMAYTVYYCFCSWKCFDKKREWQQLDVDNPAYAGHYKPELLKHLRIKEIKHPDPEVVARNIANSTRRRKERRDAARALRPDPICQCCHEPFKAKRTDAKYCSDACRQNGHRAKSEHAKT